MSHMHFLLLAFCCIISAVQNDLLKIDKLYLQAPCLYLASLSVPSFTLISSAHPHKNGHETGESAGAVHRRQKTPLALNHTALAPAH